MKNLTLVVWTLFMVLVYLIDQRGDLSTHFHYKDPSPSTQRDRPKCFQRIQPLPKHKGNDPQNPKALRVCVSHRAIITHLEKLELRDRERLQYPCPARLHLSQASLPKSFVTPNCQFLPIIAREWWAPPLRVCSPISRIWGVMEGTKVASKPASEEVLGAG